MLNEKGFTLIEIIISMGIFAIIAAALVSLFSTTGRTHYKDQQMLRIQQDVRNTKSMLARELKMAGYNPNSTATVFGESNKPIENPNSTSVTIRANFNGNNAIDDDERIEFKYDEDKLKKDGSVLMEDVGNFTFTYELKNGTQFNSTDHNSSQIRKINFELCGYLDAIDYSYCIDDSVICRNMHLYK